MNGDCNNRILNERPKPYSKTKWNHTVYFENDSASVAKKQEFLLQNFLEQIPAPYIYSVKIVGHTDAKASLEYNFSLSESRAAEIKNRMIKFGFNNVTSNWSGEERPLNGNRTEKEKAMNRRVEINITP